MESGDLYKDFSFGPRTPENYDNELDQSSFSAIKESLTNQELDPVTEERINSLISSWLESPEKVMPYQDMRDVLETTRQLSLGKERVRQMNSIIRTLGRPDNLATYLDMLRDSATRSGTEEQKICKDKLQNVKMHSIYGWCGNTLSVESWDSLTDGTFRSNPELGKKLGNSPSAWNLTIHVWQPNLTAEGFALNSERLDEDSILEPPHSHPFDFVSKIVKGNIHQSIYRQKSNNTLHIDKPETVPGYYDKNKLLHVDGVWPPHDFQQDCDIETLEHRVPMNEGDSYYMPCNFIHDVEVGKKIARSKPTISLFLSSEYIVMPHVYMTKTMSDFHEANPDIKRMGTPIPEDAWHKKLKAISAYLRGESETLDLNEIVNWKGKYAFHNVRK
ncbi:MAG: hypothetical protein WDZ75_00860 [Candidatus Paceibacterota bacterium]